MITVLRLKKKTWSVVLSRQAGAEGVGSTPHGGVVALTLMMCSSRGRLGLLLYIERYR
jgi:hypothetical protein